MIVQNDEPLDSITAADAELILRSRSGDGTAFGELWRRHYPSGIAVARSITSSIEPDDLVQEAYTRIYQAILKGGGPNGSFRAYLFTSIRNTAAAWGRARRETAVDELETVADPDSTEQAANEALDRGLTAQAFRSLPTRWQEVLWYTEIEQMKPAEVAPLLGMKAGAVSQLAFRAREGLREAWIQAHLRNAASDTECHWTIEHLGAHSRGNLSTRDQKRIDQHLEDCARCLIVASEAQDVSSRLALVLLPLVLGVTGATGYAAMLQHGGAPVVAVAAMPSSVISGGVVAHGAVPPAGFDAASGAAGSGSASGAGSAGSTSGGGVTGIGALVGTGSAVLVVAGVVAAAAIVPGLMDASPVASLPNAGDADSSSISSEVVPDRDIESDEKTVLEIPDTTPKQDADTTPDVVAPADPVEETTEFQDTGDGEGNDGVGSTDPNEPGDSGDDEGTGDDEDAGDNDEDNGGDEGNDDGGEDEGNDDGGEDDGNDDGGEDDGNGGEDDETNPTNPDEPDAVAPVTIAGSSFCLNSSRETVVSVNLEGEADAAVQPYIAGSTDGTRSGALDADGTGTVTLKPTGLQILFGSRVDFAYIDLGAELTASTTLRELGVTVRAIASAPSCETGVVAQESTPETPVAEQTVTDKPAVKEPVTEEPTVEEPAVEEPTTEEPTTEEPVTDDHTTDTEDPAVDTTSETRAEQEEPVEDETGAADEKRTEDDPAAEAPADETVPAE